jgi:co-chaperonin GroES (HSP10)
MALNLLPGRVAIHELEPRRIGLIHVPDHFYDSRRAGDKSVGLLAQSSHRGLVLAAGPPARMPWGSPLPLDFEVGDEVVYVFSLGGTEVSRRSFYGGKPCVMIAQEEVLAVLE